MTEQFIIDIDYAHDCEQFLIDTLYECEKLGGEIIFIEMWGCASDNPNDLHPNVRIKFPSKEIAQNWLINYYFENNQSLIDDNLEHIMSYPQ